MQHDEQWLEKEHLIDEIGGIDAHTNITQMEATIAKKYQEHMQRLMPAHQYHEDMGPVLWHRLPVVEPPHVGSTLDEGWFDEPVHILRKGETNAEYYTHFQLIHIPEH